MGPNRVHKEILTNMAVSVFKKENCFETIVDSQEVVRIEGADPVYPSPLSTSGSTLDLCRTTTHVCVLI